MLLHELLVQRLRVSSAGASNSAGSGSSGAEVAGSGGTAVASAEATLAPNLHAHQQRQQPRHPSPAGGSGSGGTVGAGGGEPTPLHPSHPPHAAPRGVQQPRPQARPASAPAPTPPLQAQDAGRRALPAAATRLPPHLLHLRRVEGGSGEHTPHSARSVESAWSDSGGPVVVWSSLGWFVRVMEEGCCCDS